MSSEDIEEMYEKLLKIYKVRHGSTIPRASLYYRINELKREGKTREEAIITLYEEEGKKTPAARAPKITPPSPPERLPEKPYERKFSLTQRFYKLLTAPSEAMRDIALAPDYEGVLVVIALEVVFLSVAVVITLQKIQISGPHAETIWGMVSDLLVAAIIVAGVIVLPIKWLIKSLIVKYACDSGSEWNFKTVASITGYAYIADIIMGIIGICIGWFLLPTFHLDSTDLEAMRQAFNDYQAQLNWLTLVYALPFSLFGLLWKSYLGGLGAHFGTKERCSLGMGIAVFFVLSLIGFLISFIT